MKKSMLEKTIDSIEKQNQRVRQQQIRHHETIQNQIKLQKKTVFSINTRREWYPTFSFGSEMWVCYNHWWAHHYFV